MEMEAFPRVSDQTFTYLEGSQSQLGGQSEN